jgi:hypothetical protein
MNPAPPPLCRIFDPEELKRAAENIAFEILHFRSFAILKDNQDLRHFCPAASQATRYGALLHLRVLIDFFYGTPKKPDDCNVVHFRILPRFLDAFPASLHERNGHTDEVVQLLAQALGALYFDPLGKGSTHPAVLRRVLAGR